MITIFLYIMLTLFCVLYLLRHVKKSKNYFFVVFYATFTIYYAIIPLMINCLLTFAPRSLNFKSVYIKTIREAESTDRLIVVMITMIVAGTIIILQRLHVRVGCIGIKNRRDLSKSNIFDSIVDDRILYHIGIALTIIGLVAVLGLFHDLGGVRNALALGPYVRSYRSDNAAYLTPVGAICKSISPFIMGGFFCMYCTKIRTLAKYVFFSLSLVFSGLFLVFNNGRSNILVFAGCVFFAYLHKRKIRIVWLVVIAYIMLLFMSDTLGIVMNNIAAGNLPFDNVNYNLVNDLGASVADLSFPYSNLLISSKLITTNGPHYCLDYITWFFELIPIRLFSSFGITIPSIQTVTGQISRYYIEFEGSLGGTPADFITYGLFQGRMLGLIISCGLLTYITRVFNEATITLPRQYVIIRYRLYFFLYDFVTNSDIPLVIKSNLFIIVIVIFLVRYNRKYQRKKNLESKCNIVGYYAMKQ